MSRNALQKTGLMVACVLLAACSSTAGERASPTSVASGPSNVPTSSPSTAPRPTGSASQPSIAPSATPGHPGAVDAPEAVLIFGGQRFPGKAGGYTFKTYSQSAPWLPATALERVELPADATVVVELDDSATAESWAVAAATAADSTGDSLSVLGEGTGPLRFTGPAAGDWVISVSITYGAGLGSGAYFWHLVVS